MTRLLRVLASIAASVVLVAGVPALLATTIGNPADRLPDLLAGDVNDQVLLAAIAAVVWLAWAQFTVAFVVELISAVRRTPMPARIPGVFTAQQGLARALVSGALLLLPLTVSTVAPAAQAIAMTPATVPASTSAAAGATVAKAVPRPEVPTEPVTVTAGGARTWWDLAAAHLGDGARWQELWNLNQGRTQDDGTVLRGDRTVLKPGWTVLVPATAATADRTGTGAVAGGDVDVTVRPGDTLSEIAQDHGAADWTPVWQANADRTEPDGERFTDPDYIEPGWTITIPAAADPTHAADDPAPGAADSGHDAPAGTRVLVRPGDTLTGIAAAHGADPAAVLAANTGTRQPDGQQLTDPDHIEPGWTITIPSGRGPVVSTRARRR